MSDDTRYPTPRRLSFTVAPCKCVAYVTLRDVGRELATTRDNIVSPELKFIDTLHRADTQEMIT
jgi:hypothetical protein